MYLPPKFKFENQAEILEIIGKYPLATVISNAEEGPFVSHLPLVMDHYAGGVSLLGHLARANPHWKLLNGSEVTAIFHGPNAYITPKWYAENDVPTWNYAVVHIKGRVELIDEKEGIIDCLKKLTAHAEAGSKAPWEFWIPEERANLSQMIVGFRIVVDEMNAKFKMSQNRSDEDRKGAIEGLKDRGDETSREVARLMSKLLL
jgi:transcriptional regulator